MSLLEDYYDIWNKSTDFAVRMVFLAKRLNSGPTGFFNSFKTLFKEEEFSSSNQHFADAFPNKAKLIACAMVLPVSTADFECTFFAMSRTKTNLRNRKKT